MGLGLGGIRRGLGGGISSLDMTEENRRLFWEQTPTIGAIYISANLNKLTNLLSEEPPNRIVVTV